jgi:ABC-type nitrate/sulfonate/bicarbonate transport system substrate-binding protein
MTTPPPISRRHAFAALAVPALLTGRAGAQAALRDLTYVTPFGNLVAYAPDYVASTNGHFARNGLRVRIQGGTGSAAAVQQVVSGQALIARTGGIDVVRAVSTAGAPVRAIGTIAHSSTFHVVSAAAAPLRSAADMAGKTIGIVSAGGGSENYLDIMLAAAGVAKDRVQRQVVGNSPGAFEMVQLRRLDGFICDAGVVVQLRARNAPIHAINVNAAASIPGQVYIASERSIAEAPEVLLGYLRAIQAAVQEIKADASGEATLRAMQPFELQELRAPETAKAVLRAEEELWQSEGAANIVRILPDAWRKGWREMVGAGLAREGDPDRAFTTAFSDRL